MGRIKYYKIDEILSSIQGVIVVCDIDGSEKEYGNVEKIKEKMEREHKNIVFIMARDNKIVLTLQKDETILNDLNAPWVKDYMEKEGTEPSFF